MASPKNAKPKLQNFQKKEVVYVDLPSIVGVGYGDFWRSKKRYRVVKGGRASKKSTTMSMWCVWAIMKYPLSNVLVVRRTYNTHKDSTFAMLKWAVERMKVSHLWVFKETPLEAVYKPTGQKILFRGFDDPLKLTSITVAVGVLNLVWLNVSGHTLINSSNCWDTLARKRGQSAAKLFDNTCLCVV